MDVGYGREEMSERMHLHWLCSVPGIGGQSVRKVLEKCGSAKAFYEGGAALWEKVLTGRQVAALCKHHKEMDPERIYEELIKRHIRFLTLQDREYPGRLREIPDAPYALYVKGKTPEEKVLSVAVVGARDSSEYGRFVAMQLGRTLGMHGVQVISGMARGIDGISQRAALEVGGTSFGVLGSGVDVCYPRENKILYEQLCERGGVLSIYPPGTEAKPQHFPPRNRIVSGLADALVVIEARNKSGTLITVDMALEQGREVFAVPGRVTDRLSDGCNQLIKQGAGVFLSPEDFLEEISVLCEKKSAQDHRNTPCDTDGGTNIVSMETPLKLRQLAPELQEVYAVLDFQPKTIETIAGMLEQNYPTARLTVLLMRLCMEGLAVQLTPGYFSKKM